MIVNVHVDTFRSLSMGRGSGFYLDLKKAGETVWNLRQVSEKEMDQTQTKKESLVSLSGRLSALIDGITDEQKAKFVLCRNATPVNGFNPTNQEDAFKVITTLQTLSEKVKRVRERFDFPCQFMQTLFNRIPAKMYGFVEINAVNDNREVPIADILLGIGNLGLQEKETNLPIAQRLCTDIKGKIYDKKRSNRERLLLLTVGIINMVKSIFLMITIPITLAVSVYKSWNADAWPNKGWKFLDITMSSIIVYPLTTLATSIKMFSGAIIHPNICVGDLNL